MKKTISFFTSPYQQKDFYIRKKAEYASVFMMLILLSMLTILGSELGTFGFSRVKVITTSGFLLGFGVLFIVFKAGYLETSLNLLLLAGLLRCLMIMDYYLAIQFYATLFLILLTMGVVHIKSYQLYCSYAGSLALFFMKMLSYKKERLPHPMDEFPFHQALYSLFIVCVFIIMIHFIVKVIEREIQESVKLEKLAETDALTGAGNRRKFHSALSGLQSGGSFSLLLIDLDHFKRINDTHGHSMGDQILQEMVRTLQKTIRDEDSLYRWGGEEFILLLPHINKDDLRKAAERIRKTVEEHSFPDNIKVTISIGGAMSNSSADLAELIRVADEELYRAKESGRNCVSL